MPGWRNFMEFHHQNGDRDLIRSRTGGVEHLQSFPIQTWISHPQQNVMEWNLQNWKGGPSPHIFIMFSICVQWPQQKKCNYSKVQIGFSQFGEAQTLRIHLEPPKPLWSVNLCCPAAISPLMTLKSSVGPTVSSSWKLGMVGSPGFHGGWYLLLIIIMIITMIIMIMII